MRLLATCDPKVGFASPSGRTAACTWQPPRHPEPPVLAGAQRVANARGYGAALEASSLFLVFFLARSWLAERVTRI